LANIPGKKEGPPAQLEVLERKKLAGLGLRLGKKAKKKASYTQRGNCWVGGKGEDARDQSRLDKQSGLDHRKSSNGTNE